MDSKSKPNHRRSPSFLDPPPKFISSGAGDELNEDDVFWTGDFSEARSTSSDHRHAFKEEEKNRSGILAALSDNRKPNRPVLYRKTSTSRIIPAIPKPKPPPQDRDRDREYSQSMPPQAVRKFQQSAPVNVPMMMQRRKADVDHLDLDDEEEEMMLPPHEIVARGSANAPITSSSSSSSVLEGVGRTLKGRDLRLVRNAVWRQTGFLD